VLQSHFRKIQTIDNIFSYTENGVQSVIYTLEALSANFFVSFAPAPFAT
jgi:hypothetical protein